VQGNVRLLSAGIQVFASDPDRGTAKLCEKKKQGRIKEPAQLKKAPVRVMIPLSNLSLRATGRQNRFQILIER
jgi:hypothetical protein